MAFRRRHSYGRVTHASTARASAQKCMIYWEKETQSYAMSSSWSPKLQGFIDALKPLIPNGARSYDPETKIWRFNEQYGEAVAKLAQTFLGDTNVVFTKRQDSEEGSFSYKAEKPLAEVFKEFDALLPEGITYDRNNPPTVKIAFLKACKKHHPDLGGSAESMAKLNECWQRIEKEIYK